MTNVAVDGFLAVLMGWKGTFRPYVASELQRAKGGIRRAGAKWRTVQSLTPTDCGGYPGFFRVFGMIFNRKGEACTCTWYYLLLTTCT